MSEEPTIEQLYERYLEAKKAYLDAHYKSLVAWDAKPRPEPEMSKLKPWPANTGGTLKMFTYVPLPAGPGNGVLNVTAVEVPNEETPQV
jgi:hypothetical protein